MIALLHGAPVFGAVEQYAADIVAGLKGEAEEVALVYPGVPELAPFDRLAGENVRVIPLPAELTTGSAPRLVAHLARLLRELRPRLVHFVDVWPPALVAARLAGVPRILVTHHTVELPRRDNLAGKVWWHLGWLTRPEVVYISETNRRNDRRRLKSHVMYYGVPVERLASARPALEKRGRLVGNVARLAEQKGQRYLIEAAPRVLERHLDVRFVFVGEGELRAELEERVRAAALGDRFLFTGARDDVPELVASFDVFAFPSLYEGLPHAVIEAQAAGVPVIATPTGGLAEIVRPGETGLLCPPGDAAALADGIVWLLDHPEEARRMAERAQREALERFSIERLVEQARALYGGSFAAR